MRFLLRCFDAFMQYLAEQLQIKDEFFSVSSRLEALGYSDEDGALFYLELLERFVAKNFDQRELKEQLSELRTGEVRAFRVARDNAMELCSKQICDHAEEFFGVKCCAKDWLTFIHADDGGVICVLSDDHESIKNYESELARLPSVQFGEKIRYTVFGR